jgi:hypothetical protein
MERSNPNQIQKGTTSEHRQRRSQNEQREIFLWAFRSAGEKETRRSRPTRSTKAGILKKLSIHFTSSLLQVYLVQLNPDEGNVDANAKLEGLRNQSPVDDLTLINLWRSTLDFRRKEIRNKTTQEILHQYPEYSKPALVSDMDPLISVDFCICLSSDFRRSQTDNWP